MAVVWFFLLMLTAGAAGAQTLDALRAAFPNPPAAARPWVHWFWVDGNISREGITADLEAMNRVGIGGAVLMDVALEAPPGPVNMLSPQWHEMFNHATREASRLGLQLAMHNGPGWTGSGGPWVTPDLGMQRLVWSTTNVFGPARLEITLPKLPSWKGHVWPIGVLAFPTRVGDGAPLTNWPAKITTSAGKTVPGSHLWDNNPGTDITLPPPGWFRSRYIEVSFDQPTTVGHLLLCAPTQQDFHGLLQVSPDGSRFQTIREFFGHEKDLSLEIGNVTGRAFRVVVTRAASSLRELRFSELQLSPVYRIPEYVSKSGMTRGIKSHATPAIPDAAIISSEATLDISENVDSQGRLKWDAPSGRWTVLRLGHMPTGRMNNPPREGGRGLETDKLSAAATAHHLRSMIGQMKSNAPPESTSAFSFTHTDSWEMGFQNWTPKFREEFTRRRGYDPLKFLPAMTGRYVGSPEVSERFLWDVRRTIADLQADNYAAALAEAAHSFGLKLSAEAYGNGPLDNLLYASRVDVPMSEFWNESDAYGKFHWSKSMASAAHLYGKPIVAAESFSSWPYNAAWRNHPFTLKMLGDTAFTYGVNRLVFHRFVHQPWLHLRPGMTLAYWGVHYERTQTWWEYTRPWHDYVRRCQHLLQAGRFVADVCYLTDEGAYNEPLTRDQLVPSLPPGYDYDLAPPDAVFHRMSVRNGRIVLPDGMSYAALVLPKSETMTPALLRRIRTLVNEGAVIVGSPPKRSPSLAGYPACDEEVAALARELWGQIDGKAVTEHKLGAGRIVHGKPLGELLANLGAGPDFRVLQPASASLRYLHRSFEGGHAYFVANPQPGRVAVSCEFRAPKQVPEIWEPDTGNIRRVAGWRSTPGGTVLDLTLDPYGSCFVVFRDPPDLESPSAPDPAPRATGIDPVVQFTLNGQPHTMAGLEWNDSGDLQISTTSTGRFEATLSSGRKLAAEVAALPPALTIDQDWLLEFPRANGDPLQLQLHQLTPWNEHTNPHVRYFSGTATYRRQLLLAPTVDPINVWLDLGRVAVIAEVKVNNQPAGTLWKPPFALPIGHLLKPGTNQLEIAVVNLWPNRMIGDEHLPPDCEWDAETPGGLGNRLLRWPAWLVEGRPRPTTRETFATRRFYDKNSPLLESGLLGPVTLTQMARPTFTEIK